VLNSSNLSTISMWRSISRERVPTSSRASPPGPNKKQPCKGVYWRSVSTRDEVQIRHLWSRHPDAVPGIDLAKSGLLVIDCDRKLNNGLEWFQAEAAKHSDALDNVPQTDTPSGGRHHFYKNTFEPPHGNGRGQLPPKREADVDVRGHGGFVIGPGAMFSDGTGLCRAMARSSTRPSRRIGW
jgi:hypothetical protein